ncbi:FAD binding domain-containing protein [Ferrovibrio sp.]|uniref:FAD binding domain-containing protein n=1 Tax=Ferrovibrio sp. TaxID=1917215 RepID=UPI003D2D59A0
MTAMAFDYSEPQSIAEGIALAGRFGPAASFIAGGTDLVIQMRRKSRQPSHVISLQALDELKQIERDGDIVTLGALLTHKQLEDYFAAEPAMLGLIESARVIGGHQVRNAGTIGGNICNASPAADLLPQLLTLGAEVELAGPAGRRWLKLSDFLLGPGRTARAQDELLTRVRFAMPGKGGATAFIKAGRRRAMEISLISVAVRIAGAGASDCGQVAIAIGAAAPVAFRASEAEALLHGQPRDAALLKRAGEVAAAQATPLSDVRASADYRRRLIAALVPRAVMACLERLAP